MEGMAASAHQIESRSDAWTSRSITRFEDGVFASCDDSIIQEYSIEVWINGVLNRSITASPWNLVELAIGELCLDGLIASKDQVISCEYDAEKGRIDVVCAETESASSDTAYDSLGKETGAQKDLSHVFPKPADISLTPTDVSLLISLLEDGSALFHRTGGVHSAVLLDKNGIEAWFEDIGRHSALDKLVGWCLLQDIDPSEKIVVFSGRVPFEIISKLGFLGVPCVISPGAPTSASIDFAEKNNITLIGFAKEGRFNVYAHPERIAL